MGGLQLSTEPACVLFRLERVSEEGPATNEHFRLHDPSFAMGFSKSSRTLYDYGRTLSIVVSNCQDAEWNTGGYNYCSDNDGRPYFTDENGHYVLHYTTNGQSRWRIDRGGMAHPVAPPSVSEA